MQAVANSTEVRNVRYVPDGLVLTAYYWDDSEVAIIQGPLGSGTSSCSVQRLARHAMEQKRGPDGIRRSKWLIVRDTYPNLEETTLPDFLEWFSEEDFGEVRRSKPFKIRWQWDDVDAEFIFMALEGQEDIKKLRSLKVTGAWINEGSFCDKAIFDEIQSRCGRFPAEKDGGSTWAGVIVDMNAPEVQHWVPIMRGEQEPPDWMTEEDKAGLVRPEGWRFFVQPPALIEKIDPGLGVVMGYEVNPQAENLRHLKAGYYARLLKGKSKSWIDTRLMNRAGTQVAGEPVWPGYSDQHHWSNGPIEAKPGHAIVVGIDFGRKPAAVALQKIGERVFVLGECYAEGMGASRFAPYLKSWLANNFPGQSYVLWGDPSGDYEGQADDQTPFMIFRGHGMPVMPAPGDNRLSLRVGSVENALARFTPDGVGFILSSRCSLLRSAMQGGYRYSIPRGGLKTDVKEPVKDRYSHVADALQYAMLGAGEGIVTLGLNDNRPRRHDTGGKRGQVFRRRMGAA